MVTPDMEESAEAVARREVELEVIHERLRSEMERLGPDAPRWLRRLTVLSRYALREHKRTAGEEARRTVSAINRTRLGLTDPPLIPREAVAEVFDQTPGPGAGRKIGQ